MKVKLPRGTRDFGSEEVFERRYIFSCLQEVFELFAYSPLETPAIEELNTLMGKYGDEGDALLYKLLKNGDFTEKISDELWQSKESGKLLRELADRGLRYDLTVPFARYLAMNRGSLSLPFKRYQIQPVWRGDNPQHGRYREFYQCDVDVAGSPALLYEAELLQIYDQVFKKLELGVCIRLNNRKLLEALAEVLGHPEQFVPITMAMDKLDKIGRKGVWAELRGLGLDEAALEKLGLYLDADSIESLSIFFADNTLGQLGLEELKEVFALLEGYQFHNKLLIDSSLARGLNYYTGCIVEVVVDKEQAGQEGIKMGSLGGGGRYANLTGVFGFPDCPGVGISFGADRIHDVLKALGKFEALPKQGPELLLLPMDTESIAPLFCLAMQLRQEGIKVAVYPQAAKFKKQMNYANKQAVPFVGIMGSDEREAKQVQIKNMATGEQQALAFDALASFFRSRS